MHHTVAQICLKTKFMYIRPHRAIRLRHCRPPPTLDPLAVKAHFIFGRTAIITFADVRLAPNSGPSIKRLTINRRIGHTSVYSFC